MLDNRLIPPAAAQLSPRQRRPFQVYDAATNTPVTIPVGEA
ncbi:hypothetical protein [Streptomyces phaeoluteigriseus]|nr:hypothetical protein [Streptomyces phaeoluteigriseus]